MNTSNTSNATSFNDNQAAIQAEVALQKKLNDALAQAKLEEKAKESLRKSKGAVRIRFRSTDVGQSTTHWCIDKLALFASKTSSRINGISMINQSITASTTRNSGTALPKFAFHEIKEEGFFCTRKHYPMMEGVLQSGKTFS